MIGRCDGVSPMKRHDGQLRDAFIPFASREGVTLRDEAV